MGQLIVANAARVAGWLDAVHTGHGYDDYRTLLEYIWSTGADMGMIDAIVEHSREDVKDAAMSVADRLRAQGREEGRAELLLRQLEHRFAPLPAYVEVKVLAATPQQVDAWALRVLTAASLAEALGER